MHSFYDSDFNVLWDGSHHPLWEQRLIETLNKHNNTVSKKLLGLRAEWGKHLRVLYSFALTKEEHLIYCMGALKANSLRSVRLREELRQELEFFTHIREAIQGCHYKIGYCERIAHLVPPEAAHLLIDQPNFHGALHRHLKTAIKLDPLNTNIQKALDILENRSPSQH